MLRFVAVPIFGLVDCFLGLLDSFSPPLFNVCETNCYGKCFLDFITPDQNQLYFPLTKCKQMNEKVIFSRITWFQKDIYFLCGIVSIHL
jgi:hypothetical protein